MKRLRLSPKYCEYFSFGNENNTRKRYEYSKDESVEQINSKDQVMTIAKNYSLACLVSLAQNWFRLTFMA